MDNFNQNAFNSFMDEERKRRQMQAMQERVNGGTATAEKKMSGRDIALALLPFGTILDKVTTGQKVGMGEVGLEAALTLGPGKLIKGAKLLKQGAKTAKTTKVGGRGLQFSDDVSKVAPEVTKLADEPAETIAKTSMRGRLAQKGNQKLADQYGTIPRPVARATDPSKTFGSLADLGFTKPEDVERVASRVTGSDGIVNKAVLRATGSAARVDTADLARIAQDALENNGVVEGGAKSVMAIVNAQLKRLAGGPRPNINQIGSAHPSEVMAVMKDVEKQIAQRTGKGQTYSLPTPNSVAEAKALQQFRDELEERLFTGAGANAKVADVLTPQFRQELLELAPDNAKWVNHVDNVIMKSKDVKSLRSAQSPFVRANILIDSADLNASTFGGRVGNAFGGGGAKGVLATAADATINSPTAKRVQGNALRFAGGASATPGAPKGNKFTRGVNNVFGEVDGQPIKNLGRMEARRYVGHSLVGGATGLQEGSEALDMAQLPDGSFGLPEDPSAVDFGAGGSTEQLAGGLTREEIVQAMQEDLATTGGKNIPELKTLLEAASGGAGANAKVTANQQKQLQGAKAAAGIVASIEQRLAELPGGRIAGNIGKFEGKFGLNDAVSSYEQNRPTLALMLIKALQGSAGSISDADRNAIYSSIPSSSDTAGERKRKIDQLHTLIGVYQNSAQYQTGGDTQGYLPSSVGDVQFAQ